MYAYNMITYVYDGNRSTTELTFCQNIIVGPMNLNFGRKLLCHI